MNQQFRGRDPRVEVSDVLPIIPDDLWPSGADVRLPPEQAGTIEEFAAQRLGQLAELAAGGDERAGAAMTLVRTLASDDPASVAGTFGRVPARQSTVAGVYGFAAAAFAGAKFDDATLLLAVLAAIAEGEPWGRLGLATIAIRHELDALAQTLVSEMSEKPDRHPRACSITAICALTRGRKADAQAQLAAATRLARKRAEFRSELQLAQRALLLLHLKHS